MPKLDGLALLGLDAGAGTARARTMKLGACDYLVKPFDPGELVLRIRRILSESALAGQAEAGRRADSIAAFLASEKLETSVAADGVEAQALLESEVEEENVSYYVKKGLAVTFEEALQLVKRLQSAFCLSGAAQIFLTCIEIDVQDTLDNEKNIRPPGSGRVILPERPRSSYGTAARSRARADRKDSRDAWRKPHARSSRVGHKPADSSQKDPRSRSDWLKVTRHSTSGLRLLPAAASS